MNQIMEEKCVFVLKIVFCFDNISVTWFIA